MRTQVSHAVRDPGAGRAAGGVLLGSRRVKTLLARFLLLAISLGFVVLVLEIALRVLVGPPVVFVYPQESYVHDAEMGHRLVPGDAAFTHEEPVRVNAWGMRGPETPAQAPPGTRRVLALGDSQTFGNGVAEDETWPSLLEARLEETAPGVGWQVLNAGVSGTETWQHAIWLDRLLGRVEVDAVVLGFYVNAVMPRSATPEAVGISNTWTKRVGYVAKRSAFFTFAWQSWQRLRAPEGAGDHELGVLRGEGGPGVAEGWAEVERSLAEMKARCDAEGIAFVIVVIPRRDQVTGAEPGRAYQARVVEIAAGLGIPVVDVLPALEIAWARAPGSLFIPWDGHNTGAANEVVVDAVASRLAESLGAPTPTP